MVNHSVFLDRLKVMNKARALAAIRGKSMVLKRMRNRINLQLKMVVRARKLLKRQRR